jgi:hypothetical protein
MKTINLPEAGSRVVSKSGMGASICVGGTVLCHFEDRWGSHAVVLMDDGTTRKCEGLNRGPGIGWHAA